MLLALSSLLVIYTLKTSTVIKESSGCGAEEAEEEEKNKPRINGQRNERGEERPGWRWVGVVIFL